MKLTLIPIRPVSGSNSRRARGSSSQPIEGHVFLHRKDEEPRIILTNAITTYHENEKYNTNIWVAAKTTNKFSFTDLKDGDVLIYNGTENEYPTTGTFYATEEGIFPFKNQDSISSITSGIMDNNINDFIIITGTSEMSEKVSQALKMRSVANYLYKNHPLYQNIMIRHNNETISKSLVQLISQQEPTLRSALEANLLSITTGLSIHNQTLPIVRKILSEIKIPNGFSLMTEEEQVGQFIEFSRNASNIQQEHVSDLLIENIKKSPEYQYSLEKIKDHGFGSSKTQQFNTLQQVGYFSSPKGAQGDILYNLSDMGAGKTLMTVQAIAILDAKYLSSWESEEGQEDNTDVALRLPDKHIIAPTLSIRSSWIETFEIFYDVERINDATYRLTSEFNGRTAHSTIYVSAFTIRNSMSYVDNKLPYAENGTYLIIDEIHQLSKRTISRTKFFPPGTKPTETYKAFVLSGTLSNLMTSEWLNYMKFMGLDTSSSTPQEAKRYTEARKTQLEDSVVEAVDNIRTIHQRQIDADRFTPDNTYAIEEPKMSGLDKEFYTNYGTQIIDLPNVYRTNQTEGQAFESILDELAISRGQRLFANPEEADTTNFKLFYELVGSQSITAQSTVVAEELFGEQQKEHHSDIIRTQSPLTNEDIEILKVLHRIAEDHSQYKSQSIAKSIHTAVLNLNDGLQRKDIYEIISQAAERNLRFFEYLTTLDLNVLEKLPKSNLINAPKLKETEKYQILLDILEREEDETHLIVVNDYHAMKTLSEAIGVKPITRAQLRDELGYQDTLNELYEEQSIVVVTQDMIKSSLDIVQANRLVQYQLNSEISDIIQTQNRINRIGQTRETKGYYIATDVLQENLIELFLDSYKNIRVAHKGIVELFVDVTSQINIVNDYLSKAFQNIKEVDESKIIEPINDTAIEEPMYDMVANAEFVEEDIRSDIENVQELDNNQTIHEVDRMTQAILMKQDQHIIVLVPLADGSAFQLGTLSKERAEKLNVSKQQIARIHLDTLEVFV